MLEPSERLFGSLKKHLSSNELAYEITNSYENDTSIVQYVHKILVAAVNQQASDVHFECHENYYQIRFRLDGILQPYVNPPMHLANRIITRLKIMAHLDIAERRLPQDGRFKLVIDKTSVQQQMDCRMSTCPTIHGEKIVIRILNSSNTSLTIDNLGLTYHQKNIFLKYLAKPQGMILVTGTTGSGKTMTLYSAIKHINDTSLNISTVEDPVEIYLPSINQVNINPKAGLDFASVLRAFLRQDPDVIMVGEIRDLETAEICVRAAHTGHLVLSTLHTNSATETLTRLLNLGIPLYNIATSLKLIIAQRLVRRLCDYCKREITLSNESLKQEGFVLDELTSSKIYIAHGCNKCIQGYKGRLGIFELFPITELIQHLILSNNDALTIATQAKKAGMVSLRAIGLLKVSQGLTSLSELNRVIKE